MLRRIVQPFYTAYAVVVFCVCFLVVLAIMWCSTVRMKKSLKARKSINAIARFFFKFYLWLIGMPAQMSGKRVLTRCVYVANHTSYLDTVLIFAAINTHFHTLGKAEASRIPLYNYFYNRAAILIDRNDTASRVSSVLKMCKVLQKDATSVLIFPEGTFNQTGKPLKEFYDGAFWLAINTQTPIVPILFPDAIERWPPSKWWKLWPSRNRVIFLEPISVTGLSTNDTHTLKKEVYNKMEVALMKCRAQR